MLNGDGYWIFFIKLRNIFKKFEWMIVFSNNFDFFKNSII